MKVTSFLLLLFAAFQLKAGELNMTYQELKEPVVETLLIHFSPQVQRNIKEQLKVQADLFREICQENPTADFSRNEDWTPDQECLALQKALFRQMSKVMVATSSKAQFQEASRQIISEIRNEWDEVWDDQVKRQQIVAALEEVTEAHSCEGTFTSTVTRADTETRTTLQQRGAIIGYARVAMESKCRGLPRCDLEFIEAKINQVVAEMTRDLQATAQHKYLTLVREILQRNQ